jgi:hypothetical protein
VGTVGLLDGGPDSTQGSDFTSRADPPANGEQWFNRLLPPERLVVR